MVVLQDIVKPYSCCPHVVAVIGKGGVGKTTVSLLLGSALARLGRTLVLSLDPAKHLAKYVEEVFLRVLSDVYASRDYGFIVVDTPSTEVALGILYLPALYMVWLDKLIKVRERIVSLRYVIARTMGREVELRDKALSTLLEMRECYSSLIGLLKNPERTSYVVVATPGPLPVYEMEVTVGFLEKELGAPVKALVLNKVLPDEIARGMGVEQRQRGFIEKLSSIKKPVIL